MNDPIERADAINEGDNDYKFLLWRDMDVYRGITKRKRSKLLFKLRREDGELKMTKLKPCPFCGNTSDKFTISCEMTAQSSVGYSETSQFILTERQIQIIKLICQCGCRFERAVTYSNEFAEAWNGRVKDEAD